MPCPRELLPYVLKNWSLDQDSLEKEEGLRVGIPLSEKPQNKPEVTKAGPQTRLGEMNLGRNENKQLAIEEG